MIIIERIHKEATLGKLKTERKTFSDDDIKSVDEFINADPSSMGLSRGIRFEYNYIKL